MEQEKEKNNTKEVIIGAISKQDQYSTAVKQKESIISKNKKDELYKKEELDNATQRDKNNDLEQTTSERQRNKKPNGENVENFPNATESSFESAMDVNSAESNDSKRCAECKLTEEIHCFMSHKISIVNSTDFYWGVKQPAAGALVKFLATPGGQEQVNLLDKTTLVLNAGTGLLSVVSTLLGAKVTATAVPEILDTLRSNLDQNTRGCQRHKPLVAALNWGDEQMIPPTECHYDYVLAADVVHHLNNFTECLVTMRHFCQHGTNLIWADEVCDPSYLDFVENFKKAFNVTLVTELERVRIYLATHRFKEEKERDNEIQIDNEKVKKQEISETRTGTEEAANCRFNESVYSSGVKWASESHQVVITEDYSEENNTNSEFSDKEEDSSANTEQESEGSNGQFEYKRTWEPMICYLPCKEIHYFMGHEITITESFDSYGAVIWPAAVALCKYLETPAGQQNIPLCDKTVLELGAGTGLLSVVATIMGAKLTASDLPEILGNLRYNLNRNTKWMRRHEPQVIELSWGNKLEESFPHCTHHYDYVLAADVVYHHNFLAELLATMHYFCQPGTTLIWANKTRYPTDLDFAEKFNKLFHATLLAELDDIKIYSATYKSSEENTFSKG